jgi:hypothetical protein
MAHGDRGPGTRPARPAVYVSEVDDPSLNTGSVYLV